MATHLVVCVSNPEVPSPRGSDAVATGLVDVRSDECPTVEPSQCIGFPLPVDYRVHCYHTSIQLSETCSNRL